MVSNITPALTKFEGKLEVYKSLGQNTEISEALLLVLRAVIATRSALAKSLPDLIVWVERTERDSVQNRERLLTLLGLRPDATNQEIQDAIDDVAPVFADYRKKKRGT